MARALKLTFRLIADSAGMRGELRAAEKATVDLGRKASAAAAKERELGTAAAEAGVESRGLADAAAAAAARERELSAAAAAAEARTRKLEDAAEAAAAETRELGAASAAAAAREREMTAAADAATAEARELAASADAAAANSRELGASAASAAARERELGAAADAASARARELGAGAASAAGRTRDLARAARRGEVATRSFAKSLARAHGSAISYLAGLGGLALAGRGLVRHAEAYTRVANAARLAAGAGGDLAAAMNEVFDIAHRTRSPVGATAELYQRLSISQRELGASGAELFAVVEGVGQALAIGGTTTQAAAGALQQFGQALGGAIVEAEEFGSLQDAMLPLLQAVAANIERTGGSVTKLRAEVKAQNVTSGEFFRALLAGLPQLQAQFESILPNLAGGLTQVNNALTQLVGGMDAAAGASGVVTGYMEDLADVLRGVDAGELADGLTYAAGAAGAAALVFGVKLAGSLSAAGLRSAYAATALQIQAVAATNAASKTDVARLRMIAGASAARRYGAAVRVASFATRGLSRALALLGGPAGAAVLAAYTVYEIATAFGDADDAADGAAQSVDEFAASLEKLTHASEVRVLLPGLNEAVADAEADLADARARLERAQSGKRRTVRVGNFGFQSRPAADEAEIDEIEASIARATRRVEKAREKLDAAVSARDRLENPAAASAAASAAGTEPLDPALRRILDGLRTQEEEINAGYQAQIDALEKGRAKLEARGRDVDADVAELGRRRDADLGQAAARRQADEDRARDEAFRRTGLPGILERFATEDAVTEQAVSERLARDLAALNKHGGEYAARVAAQGTTVAELEKNLRKNAADEILAIRRKREADELELEREKADEAARLRQRRHADELADELGFTEELVGVHHDRAGRLAELQAEQLAQRAGYDSVAEQQALAHKQRLIDADLQYAGRVNQIAGLIAEFEAKRGIQRVQVGLEIGKTLLADAARQNKAAFRAHQAFSIAQAIIAGHTAVAKTFAQVPFPANIAVAGLIGAATGAEIAAIAAQKPPSGYARGGVVEDAVFFTARGVPRGVAGEAGPEAIMPLRRTASGRLGVEAAGGGRGERIEVSPVVNVGVAVEAGGAAGDRVADAAAMIASSAALTASATERAATDIPAALRLPRPGSPPPGPGGGATIEAPRRPFPPSTDRGRGGPGRAGAAAAPVVNVTVNVGGGAGDAASAGRTGDEVGRRAAEAVRAVIADEMRPGGMLDGGAAV